MNKLIAGPWVGEFGWELFAWQGYIRALSRKFEHTTIIARPDSAPIYEDFCDAFYEHTPVGGIVDSFFMHKVDLGKDFKKVVVENKIKLDTETTLLTPRRVGMPPLTHFSQPVIFGSHIIKPEYKIFGSERTEGYDYIFHIRNRQSVRPADNWSTNNWQELLSLLGDKRVACIGTKSESGWIEGTDDKRDIELNTLFDLLHNAKCAFGSSSGPMHLASLCNTPHVVWSTPNNKVRYEENWNPHNTKVCFFSDHDWHPTATFVHQKYLNFKEE